jgi:hypothetical protein
MHATAQLGLTGAPGIETGKLRRFGLRQMACEGVS